MKNGNRSNKANTNWGNLGDGKPTKENGNYTNVSITNRIQEMEERILGMEDTIKEIEKSAKENAKS